VARVADADGEDGDAALLRMPRFFARAAASSASPRKSPPSEMRMIALWSSAAAGSASRQALIAEPSDVSPRGAESGVSDSSALRR